MLKSITNICQHSGTGDISCIKRKMLRTDLPAKYNLDI